MFFALVDLYCALQAAIRVHLSQIARARRDGILGTLLCAACVSPARFTVNVEGVPFGDTAHMAGRELLFNSTGLRSVSVIKGCIASLYLPERARDATVVLGVKSSKWLQIHPLCNVGADTFIHVLNDDIHRSQTEIQMRKPADHLMQLEDTMCQISSTRRGDTVNFDYAPDTGTTININGVTRTKAIPGEDFYQVVLSVFIDNSPVDCELENGLPEN